MTNLRYKVPFDYGLTTSECTQPQITITGGDAIPLQHVNVQANLVDFLSEVSIEQHFKNNEKDPIEAVYRFPLDANAVLKHFEVEMDGNVIKGEMKENEEAKDTYDDALAEGHGAAIVSQDLETKDIFSLRLGNLPPNATAVVRLTYVAQVDEEVGDDGSVRLRLVIPTAVAPRYKPVSDQPSELTKHAEVAIACLPEDLLNISGRVKSANRVIEVEPLSYKDRMTTDIVKGTEGKCATFSLKAKNLHEDFVLSIKLSERLQDRGWIEEGKAVTISAGLKPGRFEFKNESTSEYIFVIDRSGSMSGSSIKAAREALTLCISSLPMGSTFNIVGFGSHFQSLFPQAVPFDDGKKEEAIKHCQTMEANYGGTEILAPLIDIAKKKPSSERPRQVFVITDGEMSNSSEAISFVRKDHRASGCRYFSCGIGTGASRALVKGIAEAGNGYEEFIVDGERLQGKIMRQMNRALEPVLTNVTVDFGPLRVVGDVSPKHPRPLFSGSRLLFYAMIDPASVPSPSSLPLEATVKGQSSDGEVNFQVPIYPMNHEESPEATTRGQKGQGQLLKTLATWSILKDLEDEEIEEATTETDKATLKAKAIELSCSIGIPCKYTSFVAVSKREEAVGGSLKPVYLPLQIIQRQDAPSHQFHPRMRMLGRSHTGHAMPQTMMMAAAPMMCSMPMAAPAPIGGGGPAMYAACCSAPPMQPQSAPMSQQQRRGGGGGGGFMKKMARGWAASPPGMAMDAAFAPPQAQAESCMSFGAPASSMMMATCAKPAMPPPPPAPVMMDMDQEEMAATTAGIGGRSIDHVEIVTHQKASGEWSCGEWLAKVIGRSLDDIQQAAAAGSIPFSVWATALVLKHLETTFADFKDEWEAASRKGKRWLESTYKSSSVDDLLAQAAAFFGTSTD